MDRQILSGWADLFGYGMPAAEGARWCRLFNETLGEVAQQHDERLSALATAPLQDAQLAAQELEYGVKQCGAVGGVIAANVDEIGLGETDLDPFWATAVDLMCPFSSTLHSPRCRLAPASSACCRWYSLPMIPPLRWAH